MDRLRTPIFRDLEVHFGSPLPADLLWLYQDSNIVTKRNVVLIGEIDPGQEYEIDHFVPADLKSLQELWFEIGGDRFPFAIDGFGNYRCAVGLLE